MNRDDAERLVNEYAKAIEDYCGDNFDEDAERVDATFNRLIAALCREPNQPEGPGFYDLTVRVEVREGPCRPIMKIASLPICYPEDITGHWQKVEE